MDILHEDQHTFLVITSLRSSKNEKCFGQKFLDKPKTRILHSITFFLKNRAFFDMIWKKYCRVGQTKSDNMAHGYCMGDTQGYKDTLRICNVTNA
jgi:hypothetical protein